MPLVEDDTGAAAAMEELARFVESCGGEASMVASWRTEVYTRSTGRSAGDLDRYFYDEAGKKYRSRAEIARALGLAGAPAKRVKGSGALRAALAPGEKPAVVGFERGEEDRTFRASARAMVIEGNFTEFEPSAAIETTAWKSRARPKRWVALSENAYVWPASRDALGSTPAHEWPRCDCKVEDGCGENCVNRQLFMECPVGFCCGGGARSSESSSSSSRSGPSRRRRRRNIEGTRLPCANTVIQRRQYPPSDVFDTGDERGFGLRCRVDVKRGAVVGEYRGEVITGAELAARRAARDPSAPFYFAALGDGLYLDAERRGAYARFANHSCDPNCALEKWTVGPEPRLVLVATRDIPKFTECCYDYNAGGGVADVTHAQPCRCGAANCSGIIGAKNGGNEPGAAPRETKNAAAAPQTKKNKKPSTRRKEEPPPPPREKQPSEKKKATRRRDEPEPDGPSSARWARDALRSLAGVDSDDAPFDLASLLEPAARRAAARSKKKAVLHCLCRLPEFAAMPTSLREAHQDRDATLVCCGVCDSWYHPTCLRLPAVPSENDDFECAFCRRARGDPLPLLGIARARDECWKRALPSATRAACEAAIADSKDRVDDARCFVPLALACLRDLVKEAASWARDAQRALASPDRDPRPLAELVCRGHMLEVDDHRDDLLSKLKTALTTAANDNS
ncbi:hypothetical protein CTAYLR_010465 [Chrysophaeum taylorii]|uniref:Histone-lysine N-methyltransferase n=1 Tax=Chrysophaeum taylorii TaxID=2483200 RepID=A0AAD7U7S5_9STRA|nr:hypothetical protein CTAYLR_010465 [Chrysophaeum taylorii]